MAARGGFSFQSAPRPVQGRKKYREPALATSPGPSNIMHDKRVKRGSTYAHIPRSPTPGSETSSRANSATASRAAKRMRNSRSRLRSGHGDRPVTPDPVPGRQHTYTQTYDLLEQLEDKPPEREAQTQTEAHLDRPMSPLFVPKKYGVDQGTDIKEGDLFDFDQDVEPILEVLVGKTLDYALMEVMEEEEEKHVALYREQYEQKRDAALVVAQQLEAAEVRRFEEKERRVKQALQQELESKEEARQQAARSIAKDYLMGLEETVMLRLEQSGQFYDPVVKEVREDFIPWLLDQVSDHLDETSVAQKTIDHLLQAAVERMVIEKEEVGVARAAKREIEEKARLEREAAEALQRAKEEEEARLKRLAEEEDE